MNKMRIIIPLIILTCCGTGNTWKAKQLYEQALQSYMQKDLGTAQSCLLQAISYDQQFPDAHLLLAKTCFFRGDNDGFVDAIENYIECSENNNEGLILYARWHMKMEQTENARELLNRVIAKPGVNIKALYLMGILQLREGEKDRAVETLSSALNDYYYLSKIHTALSGIYGELGLEQRSNTHKDMADIIERFMEGI